MTVNIFVLTANGRLGKYKNRILFVAKESVKIIGKKIPMPDVDIVFYDNPENAVPYLLAIPHLGIGGYTPDTHLVFVPLNPKIRNFEKVVNEEIIRNLAHELHHCARYKAVGYGKTLLEAMITEGLADQFENELTNRKPRIWNTALTTVQIRNMKKKAAREFSSRNYNHEDWFFGSKARKIPKWTGYTLGFELVKDFLKKHSDKKPSQLFAAKAEELVK